jgi:phosphodiesterase/alkaline phosphatase D-like protein
MMPDDHEIINNIDEKTMNSEIEPVIQAGKTAFIEYQLLLMRDYKEDDNIFFFREIDGYGIAMLDFRWKRTFKHEKDSPLLGNQQFNQLSKKIKEWGDSKKINKILIFSQIAGPLLGEQASRLIYFLEQEMYTSHPLMLNHTNKMMEIFKPFASKIRWIVGDLHSFFLSKICYDKEYKICIKHMITSGMTVKSSAANR